MFGYVTANIKELSKEQELRYQAVYCGICRQIRSRSSQCARLGLSYDMAFLALLLMSLYEPEESGGNRACMLHPIRKRPWVDNLYIRYAADMNVALAYYKAQDDITDDGSITGKLMAPVFGKSMDRIRQEFPRQCDAIDNCIRQLSRLEKEGCGNPDLPAACFGQLMGELLVYHEDLWAPTLRQIGMALGRYIYLTDAMLDYRKDAKKKRYNPLLSMDLSEDWARWEQYLVMEMVSCTECFEKLPLVQDKELLNNILYSGVWTEFERRRPREKGGQEERE